MTARISNFDVDLYKVQIKQGGVVEFAFINDTGTVNILGDLNVAGNTTTISTTNLEIEDNVILLNSGETGSGITLTTAGIQIDRGSRSDARILFNESLTTYLNGVVQIPVNGGQGGAFVFNHVNGNPAGIYTSSIIAGNGNDLNLLSGQTVGVVSVTQTVDYEKQVFPYSGSVITPSGGNPDRLSNPYDDDIIPNIKSVKDYIRDYHLYNFQTKISSPTPEGDTEVQVYDTGAGDPVSKALIRVNNSTVAEFFQAFTVIEDVKITDNTIETTVSNQNLILKSNGTGSVVASDPLLFTKDSDPAAPADGTKLYGKAEGDGGTGLFFINENSTSDELISRTKALLYSIIF
jgi:hypothetical protein